MNKTVLIVLCVNVLLFQFSIAQQGEKDKNIITIGLLVNDQTALSATRAAERAITSANKNKKLNGRQFKLVTRSMEGPWGTGSKEAVNLVFKERVWALLGSHDGRNAHLAEQVIAKTQVVFLSAWATDPTLSQAYIPWFYNCVPNDIQQAEMLVSEIKKNHKLNNLAVLVQGNYDAVTALKYLNDRIMAEVGQKPLVFKFDQNVNDRANLIVRLKEQGTKAIMVIASGKQAWEIVGVLRKNGVETPVYGTLAMLGTFGSSFSNVENLSNLTVLDSGNWMKSNTLQSENGKDVDRSFSNAIEAYAFDGVNILLNAIEASGFDRGKLNETISKTNYNGTTGKIQFDENGNRVSDMKLVKIAY
ncbi:ABC transporter substrate-binding protein [Maribacter luteus]|uniref:ABC transporter substrate-binding protein n=1 Tax=Maribacter luteus TaxID=2594478 RepID=UPI002490CB62|nr:ABC transporter substrate-binding protein [Maribacter luteus]